MKGLVWKLPVLRKLSSTRRGVLESFAVVLGGSLLFAYATDGLISPPSGPFFSDLAQIGATLLIADAVQIGWILQNSRRRGADRENWIGIMAGLTACALIGILVSLLLSNADDPNSWIEQIGFGWVSVSLLLLGFLLVLQPLTTYEWAHALNTEYPDE